MFIQPTITGDDREVIINRQGFKKSCYTPANSAQLGDAQRQLVRQAEG
jgi:hypothetical protein